MRIAVNFDFNGISVVNGIATIVDPSVKNGGETLRFGVIYQADIGNPLIKSEIYECSYDLEGPDIFSQAMEFLMTNDFFSKQVA